MSISLLHPARAGARPLPVGERVCYHLSLDRAFEYICADVKKREIFFSVLRELSCDRETIRYRQAVLQDLLRAPSLAEQLSSMLARFGTLRDSQEQSAREEARLRAGGMASPPSAKNILQTQALSLKRALLFVRGFAELLAGYDLQSEALLGFRESCRSLCSDPAFDELVTACSRYEKFSTVGFLDFRFRLSGAGQISDYELVDHRFLRITDPELKKKGFSLIRKKEEESAPCERIYPAGDRAYETLTVSALAELSALFSSVSGQIFERFGALGTELIFYEVALRYICVLTEKQIPFAFPQFSEGGETAVEGLYDLYLALSSPDARIVVPNHLRVAPDAGGVAVFGDNGSGKTVFLRSVGAAQLLAQAGLPIPCERAVLPLCRQLALQFSQAEDPARGHEAGRFEQEVSELAVMVDSLSGGSLVLLNETFQSTAYAEGAEGLYHLLRHFSACGIRWILVSHLRQLEDLLGAEGNTVLHTSSDYRILPK